MLQGAPPVPSGGSPPADAMKGRMIMFCMMLPAISTHRRGARARCRRSSSPHGLHYDHDVMKSQSGTSVTFTNNVFLVQQRRCRD